MNVPIHEIAIAGGPYAGKTSLRPLLAERLRSDGYEVLLMPEVASLLYGPGGITNVEHLALHQRAAYRALQGEFLTIGENFRLSWRRIAHALDKPTIVLSDRGALDIFAYLEEDEAHQVLAERGLTVQQIASGWKGCVYLKTAAGLGMDLTHASQKTRRESDAQTALAACARTLDAWRRVDPLIVVEANDDVQAKIDACEKAILTIIDA